jgi:hypothetical protein
MISRKLYITWVADVLALLFFGLLGLPPDYGFGSSFSRAINCGHNRAA